MCRIWAAGAIGTEVWGYCSSYSPHQSMWPILRRIRPGASPISRHYFSNTAFVDYVATSSLVRSCEKVLVTIHETCGTPWWATIIVTVFSLRCLVTLPFAVVQRRIGAKLASLKPEMDVIAKRLAMEVKNIQLARRWSDIKAANVFKSEVRNETRRLWVKYNCHPAKAFLLPWFQIPLWIGLSYALRNLCAGWAHNAGQIPREDFYHGGFAWFENMAVPDKTWTLPLCYGFTNLLLCELWVAGIKQRTTLMKMAIWISRLVSVIFVPIAGALPAAVSYYWFISSLFGLVQFLLLMSPRILRLLRILPADAVKSPYRELFARLLRRPVTLPDIKVPVVK